MQLFLLGLAVVVAGGAMAMGPWRARWLASAFGAIGAVIGCSLALIPTVMVIGSGSSLSFGPVAWRVPYGSFVLELNPLSAWFALPILSLTALAAIYGRSYLLAYADRRSLGPFWFFFNALAASMGLVVVARNGMLFLMVWEIMSLASYFLVVYEHEKPAVREAGRIYLIATHLGTALLLMVFVLLGQSGDSLDFASILAAGPMTGTRASVVFVLAVIGFGTKAAFLPWHVWLPEAHPAAPSPVSAVMSGVMIKTGVYGIVMTLGFLGSPPAGWGWLLVGIGGTSGVVGVLFALAQHDLKRLLAYHSVENMGIIALGLGIGLLGMHFGQPAVTVLGFAGGLLHVVNHAAFKGLLFLGAGAVIQGAHTAQMDELGGLIRKMPLVAITFLAGAVAICGLPPLNGFVSEFLIYLAAFGEAAASPTTVRVAGLAVLGMLALIGGLAVACFTKAFGIVFLGEARSEHAQHARAPGFLMILPLVLLATACLLIGLAGPWVVGCLAPVLSVVVRQPRLQIFEQLAGCTGPLSSVVVVTGGLLLVIVGLALVRSTLLSRRRVTCAPTWDCGYIQPTARFQYTASSFAEPCTTFFATVLRTRCIVTSPAGHFPKEGALHTETQDVALNRLYRPLFACLVRWLARLHWIQHGQLNYYVLYIALTMVVLLVWFLGIWP